MDKIVGEVINRKRVAVVAAVSVIMMHAAEAAQPRKKSRMWSRPWLLRRDERRNVLNMVFKELGPEDPAAFTNYTRMQQDVWKELLKLVTPHIVKKDTVMREAITAQDRLLVTLRFLATGSTFQDMSYATRIAANTISKIVDETLEAIVKVLETTVITFPSTVQEWEIVSYKFETMWNFPHCLGAVDGKHINFRPARKDGSQYRNYKGKDSIVLLGVVDAEYKFLFADVGRNGRMHDSAVFQTSWLGLKMNAGTLNFPEESTLPGYPYALPYVLIGDDAFALKPNFLKPYPNRGLTYEQRIFNYRLSRARRTVENAFGILANRWRILLNTIPLSVEKVESITYACVLLHNFLLMKGNTRQWYVPNRYTTVNSNDEPAECELPENREAEERTGNRSSSSALETRNKFREYFNNIGAVPFQHRAIAQGNQ